MSAHANNIPVVISGVGQLSALGQGKAALLAGLAGIQKPQINIRKVKTSKGEMDIPIYQAPEVVLPSDVPESVSRRMSRISKMYFATVLEAVEDAFGSKHCFARLDPTRIGIVVGTALGCLESANRYQRRVILEGPTGASPSIFASSIQNAIASHLSISFGIQGPTSTVTTMEQTTIGAFRLAYDWIRQGIVDQVIVTVGDEMSDYQPYAMAHLGLAAPERLNPRSDACTSVVGEAMASFFVSREDLTPAPKKYCEISDVQLFPRECPAADRYLASAYGAKGQWSRYSKWIQSGDASREPLCHAELYGSSFTGSAVEVAIGALLISQDHRSTVCVQMTDRDEVQTITLR